MPKNITAETALYTLQIAAYPTLQEAEIASRSFQSKGIVVEILQSEIQGRGKVYRLRVGKFPSVETAREQAEKWLATGIIKSYWVTKNVVRGQSYLQFTTAAAAKREGITADSSLKISFDKKSQPELGLGQLLAALDGKWGVRLPAGLSVAAAQIVFPKAGIVKPAIVFVDEMKSSSMMIPVTTKRAMAHPLEMRFDPGLKISPDENGIDYKNGAKLAASLRFISGYKDLAFDDRGYLILGERIEGGSELARALLMAAIKSSEILEIEGYNNNDLVVFGTLFTADFLAANNKLIQLNRIQLDFSDFDKLQGDPEVLAAFDAGFVFLHELTHGIWELPDDDKYGGVGTCENYINQIRRQLGLPERAFYHFKVRRDEEGKEKGELMFVRVPHSTNERKQPLKLMWDNHAVGSGGFVSPTTDGRK